jgi:uncharacterized protein (DUF1697 family)
MKYVALLRGVNVGGRGKLPMGDLRKVLQNLGHTDVSTYLQSGNALFTSPRDDPAELEHEIGEALAHNLGLTTQVMIRTGPDLTTLIDNNPFPDAVAKPTTLFVNFLSRPVDPERVEAIDARPFEPDQFRPGDRAVYLWCPEGAARTKLSNTFWERRLGVGATARNWNTVAKLRDLATE